MDTNAIKIRIETLGLTVGYAHQHAPNKLLENLNLELRSGELVCFMGQNGIGKSTLIRTLAGLQQPLSGQIKYRTNETTFEKSIVELPHHLAVVLTDRISASNMTVNDIVSFGRYPYINWMAKLSPTDNEIIDQTLQEIRIQHLKDKRLYELSDGQLQMVMIARAVIQDTPIILLDEPTAHLDLNNRLEIMNVLRKLAHKSKKAILISTHELDLALQTADIIWLANHDKKIITGIPEDLVLNGAFDSVFQFKGFDLKTGKVQHEAHRGVHIKLVGTGHEHLWTKNAFERNGFIITEHEWKHSVSIEQSQGTLHWILDNEVTFTSLRELLHYLTKQS
jgi:iron complex transport system ATP-binding protein